MRARLVLAAAGFVIGCAPAPNPETVQAELLAADRAFAESTAVRGVEGWTAWFAPEGAMHTAEGPVRGHEAIREAMAGFLGDTTLHFTWEPTEAHAARGGDLGYTVGRYRVTRRADGSVLRRGTYLSVWQRDTGGAWKVLADIGNIQPDST